MLELRVLDITAGVDLLNARPGLGANQVKAIGIGTAAVSTKYRAPSTSRPSGQAVAPAHSPGPNRNNGIHTSELPIRPHATSTAVAVVSTNIAAAQVHLDEPALGIAVTSPSGASLSWPAASVSAAPGESRTRSRMVSRRNALNGSIGANLTSTCQIRKNGMGRVR
jgi:hypothetical protein